MDEENDQESRPVRSPLAIVLTIFLIVIVPLALGLFLAPRLVPKPKIGLVRVNYDIVGETAFEMGEQLAYARQDPAIEAVVLVINSPGGIAAYSEELYLDILNTREQMPVIASIDLLAASGAYYLASAADEIYGKPSSAIGNIGVIGFLPGPAFIEEELVTTGPYKAFGGTRDGTVRQMEMAKLAFLRAVELGRGDRLNADLAQLSRGELFNGVQAEELGLIDGLLSADEAIQRAAELAGLRDYETVELLPLAFPELFPDSDASSYRAAAIDPRALWAPPSGLSTGVYYRYIDPLPNS